MPGTPAPRSEIQRVLSQDSDFLQQECGIPEFLGFSNTERTRSSLWICQPLFFSFELHTLISAISKDLFYLCYSFLSYVWTQPSSRTRHQTTSKSSLMGDGIALRKPYRWNSPDKLKLKSTRLLKLIQNGFCHWFFHRQSEGWGKVAREAQVCRLQNVNFPKYFRPSGGRREAPETTGGNSAPEASVRASSTFCPQKVSPSFCLPHYWPPCGGE